ncbi:MAG: hypothetical protein IJZ86_01185 [Bacteroides sp.]|nr:hypothetical protein [Bacteroides sp.]
MENRFVRFRQKAIDWLNSSRSFSEGVAILEESKFKPGVVAKLKKQGVKGPSAEARLKFLMRELIQAWAKSSAEVNEELSLETGVNVREEQEEHTDKEALRLVEAAKRLESGEQLFPENISAVIREYSDAYKKRDVLHKQLADLPEDNEEDTMLKRKELAASIADCSKRMEELYPLYEAYNRTGEDQSAGTVPPPGGKSSVFPAERQSCVEETASGLEDKYEGKSKDELQKLRKSVATKIGRAKNMLEYQQEAKGSSPNPMPESPKRVKYETKIAALSEELEQIDYAIAKIV